MTQRKANMTFLILEPIFPSYIGNSHHHHIFCHLPSLGCDLLLVMGSEHKMPTVFFRDFFADF